MKKLILMMSFAAIIVGIAGTAQAQYGIGRYERLQVLATDLEAATRQLYFQAERQAYPYRGRDNFALDHLRSLTRRAAIFREELQTTDDPVRLRSAYQRLISSYNDARYAMRGYGGRYSDFVSFEFRNVARAMDHIGRSFFNYMDRRYDRDRYDDFDDENEYGYREDDDDDDDDYDEYDD